ncbi:hypothetical protein [Allomuricauda sp. d1]|uniref:hypothetical protein n=1 Tax=Allomuricauda sp. d1 TaxID=3136725 RepID=UPI0031D1DCC5
MKTLKLISALFVLTFFISCSDDDENTTPVDQDSLIGTWEMTGLNADIDFSGNIEGISFTSETNTVGENFDYIITFTETTYTASGSYDIVTNGTLNGVPIDEDRQTISDANESGTYSVQDGELVIDGELVDLESINSDLEGASVDGTFESFIDGNGNLVIEQVQDLQINEGGIPLDIDVDSRIVFRKQ